MGECQYQMHGPNQFCFDESWFEMMKALLKRFNTSSYRIQTGFIHSQLHSNSMGYTCMIPGFSLHCRALEHSPLIYVEANSHLRMLHIPPLH